MRALLRRTLWPFLNRHSTTIALVGITLLGAGLRFLRLDQPALWGDEIQTFRRVSGSFQYLVDELASGGGFTPLHYLLYYWIKQHTQLTPWMMRLPVAIAGTLMTPAIYFLARQFSPSQRFALLAALLTACSAYMLNFSRDAKMYQDLWLFVTLNVACLLWWLRTRGGIAFWCWTLTGATMLGIQLVSAGVLPIEFIIVLTTTRPHWRSLGKLIATVFWLPAALLAIPLGLVPIFHRWRGFRAAMSDSAAQTRRWVDRQLLPFRFPPVLIFLIGLCIIGVGPLVYYQHFNRFFERVVDLQSNRFIWFRTGIDWVGPYNEGRTGGDLLRYLGTAFCFNWEWPRPDQIAGVSPRTLTLLKGVAIACCIVFSLGALPWPPRWMARRRGFRTEVSPRRFFWLLAWIVLPTYVLYCASQPAAAWPMDWLARLLLKNPPSVHWPVFAGETARTNLVESFSASTGLYGLLLKASAFAVNFFRAILELLESCTWTNLNRWTLAVLGILMVSWLVRPPPRWRRKLRQTLRAFAVFFLLVALCTLIRTALPKPLPDSVWLPRYVGYIWPGVVLLMALLLSRIPTRPLRWCAIGLFMAINLAQHAARVFAGSEPPTALMARDVLDGQPPGPSRVFYDVRQTRIPEPGAGTLFSICGRYYLSVLSGKPVEPASLRFSSNDTEFVVTRARFFITLQALAASTVQRNADVTRLIVWDSLEPGQVDGRDKILETLPTEWRLTHFNQFAVRDHWTWRDQMTLRRRVYERR